MAALTSENKKQIKRLLRTGRWNNQSEILRYGLHLVINEVEARREKEWPEPIPAHVLQEIYENETAAERAEQQAAAEASIRASRKAVRRLKKEGY